MSSDGRDKILCCIAGCINNVDINSEYCCDHEPVSNELKTDICLTPNISINTREFSLCSTNGCTNTADFNDDLLCMVCSHTRKHTLRNENIRLESNNYIDSNNYIMESNDYVSNPCDTRGCNNNATFINKCETCNKHIINNTFLQIHHIQNPRNTSPSGEENTINDRPLENQTIPFISLKPTPSEEVEVSNNNNYENVSRKTTCPNPISSREERYENVIPIRNTMRGRILCTDVGCTNTVSYNGGYCNLHEQNTPKAICINKGCRNIAEFPDGYLCMVCLQAQRTAFKTIQYKRTINPVISSRSNVESESQPRRVFSPLVPDSSTVERQPGNASFDLKALAKCLPPIPMPTSVPTHIPEQKHAYENTDIGEVVARGVLRNDFSREDLPPMPIPFNSLPPIPIPFSRSNSTPNSTSAQVIHQFNVNAFRSKTPSLPDSISPTSVNTPLPSYIDNYIDTILNKLPCEQRSNSSSSSTKQICKASDCKFYVNEGLDGYCSECFMCYNISDNLPPSPTRRLDRTDLEEEYICASRMDNQLCKSGNCEFFGSDDFDGYCSGCYKKDSVVKTDTDVAFINDNEDKMCIICLLNVYNTVLLPCGHLYLCYECATIIKNKGRKCPACRKHIESFHRVYTPD